MGSEMCIRDRAGDRRSEVAVALRLTEAGEVLSDADDIGARQAGAVSYTHLTLPTSDLV